MMKIKGYLMKGDCLVGTKYYLNYITQEAESIPNTTEYSHNRMMQRGFKEVSDKEFDDYIRTHFND